MLSDSSFTILPPLLLAHIWTGREPVPLFYVLSGRFKPTILCPQLKLLCPALPLHRRKTSFLSFIFKTISDQLGKTTLFSSETLILQVWAYFVLLHFALSYFADTKFFYKLKICGNLTPSNCRGTIFFPIAFDNFGSLCHIWVILPILQTFSLFL